MNIVQSRKKHFGEKMKMNELDLEQLACDLFNQTQFHSSTHMMRRTAAFRELVEMGKEIIPWVIEKYRNDPFVIWAAMLAEITGEHPLEQSEEGKVLQGNVAALQQAWLEWYECFEFTNAENAVK